MAEVQVPKIDEATLEVSITKWLKRPGDRVALYEPLVEFLTEKTNVEFPSPLAGTLVVIVANEGDVVPIGATIAHIDPL